MVEDCPHVFDPSMLDRKYLLHWVNRDVRELQMFGELILSRLLFPECGHMIMARTV